MLCQGRHDQYLCLGMAEMCHVWGRNRDILLVVWLLLSLAGWIPCTLVSFLFLVQP